MPQGPAPDDASFRHLKYLIFSDLYRYDRRTGSRVFREHLFHGVGSKYMIWLRIAKYLSRKGPMYALPFLIAKFMIKRLGVKYGISIPWWIEIGPGFYVGHHGGIWVSPLAVIGRDCNISQEVTIGVGNRGKVGVPTIGDSVYLGPGAKLFGRIKVGNNVAISANAVVSRNVKPNSVVMAAPAEIVATDDPSFPIYGSRGYVDNTDYDAILQEELRQKM